MCKWMRLLTCFVSFQDFKNMTLCNMPDHLFFASRRRHTRFDCDCSSDVCSSDLPNSEILEELARQSGAEIRGQVREPREVTADFKSVPLPEALARLLGEQNFALVYRKGGRLKAVRLLGDDQAGAPTTTTLPATPAAPFPGSLAELIDRHPPVPVAGQLADALGAQSATLRQLLELSLHHEDPAVRTEALRTGIATIEKEPALRAAVISELSNADNALVGSLLRASAGEQ